MEEGGLGTTRGSLGSGGDQVICTVVQATTHTGALNVCSDQMDLHPSLEQAALRKSAGLKIKDCSRVTGKHLQRASSCVCFSVALLESVFYPSCFAGFVQRSDSAHARGHVRGLVRSHAIPQLHLQC